MQKEARSTKMPGKKCLKKNQMKRKKCENECVSIWLILYAYLWGSSEIIITTIDYKIKYDLCFSTNVTNVI